jgi:glycosyltransferase involved in cell wall biosynthesis
LYFKALLAGSLRRADLVIAVSENTKKDIMDRYSVPGSKIRVVRAGIGEMFRKLSEEERRGKIESVTGKYGIKKKFILAAARITPRKNFVRLVRAFKILKDDGKIDGQLVIVGGEGWLYKDVFKEVSSQGLEEDVIFCGYIPQKDLIYLYNAASVFVYPSLYEGFGMPILEAMSCACPVVASNTSSIPEVCGNAAILVDPVDIEEIADAINRIFNDTRGIRQEMIDKGLDHVKHFSWGKTAKDTLRIYEDVGHMSSL